MPIPPRFINGHARVNGEGHVAPAMPLDAPSTLSALILQLETSSLSATQAWDLILCALRSGVKRIPLDLLTREHRVLAYQMKAARVVDINRSTSGEQIEAPTSFVEEILSDLNFIGTRRRR